MTKVLIKYVHKEKMKIVLAGMRANISAVYRENRMSSDLLNRERELEKELKEAKDLIEKQAMQIKILPSLPEP